MTKKTDQRIQEMNIQAILANPPPAGPELPETPLFQTMDALRSRHGGLPAIQDRFYLWGLGLLVGAAVFGALFLMIHFPE